VHTSQTHLLSPYIGVGRTKPPLHALRRKRWLKERSRPSGRGERPGGPDAGDPGAAGRARRPRLREGQPWQFDFEQAFPYAETDDQLRAIADVQARHGVQAGRWTA
jgi:transcription-repair coupling factor (superfamily II helicase)